MFESLRVRLPTQQIKKTKQKQHKTAKQRFPGNAGPATGATKKNATPGDARPARRESGRRFNLCVGRRKNRTMIKLKHFQTFKFSN